MSFLYIHSCCSETGDDDHKTKMRARFLWSTAFMLALVGSQGKKKPLDGSNDMNLDASPKSGEQETKKTKLEELMEICNGSRDGAAAMRNKNLKLLPDRIHTLTALRYLVIGELPNVESFAEGGLPPNLQSFHISDCEKLKPSVEYWGLQRLVSLRIFEIWESEHLLETVLKEQLLPTTLQGLQIRRMKSLKSLEGKGLQYLTCLQELEIDDCDSLKFLPKEGYPASLSFLSIKDCPSLEKRCQKKTGQEWSKLAHIPCLQCSSSSLERCRKKTGQEWTKIAHIPCIEIGDQVII